MLVHEILIGLFPRLCKKEERSRWWESDFCNKIAEAISAASYRLHRAGAHLGCACAGRCVAKMKGDFRVDG